MDKINKSKFKKNKIYFVITNYRCQKTLFKLKVIKSIFNRDFNEYVVFGDFIKYPNGNELLPLWYSESLLKIIEKDEVLRYIITNQE